MIMMRFRQDSQLSIVYTIKCSSIYNLQLCIPVALYAVDGGWTATEAWNAVMNTSIV